MNTVEVGARVVLSEKFLQLHHWSIDNRYCGYSDRGGVVVMVAGSNWIWSGRAVIAMDNPVLKAGAGSEDCDLTSTHGRQCISIANIDWIEKEASNTRTDIGIYCYDCNRVVSKRTTFQVCDRGHFACARHVMSWNTELNIPAIHERRVLRRLEELRKLHDNPGMDIPALLEFDHSSMAMLVKCMANDTNPNIFSEFLSSYKCGSCHDSCSFELLDAQLFPVDRSRKAVYDEFQNVIEAAKVAKQIAVPHLQSEQLYGSMDWDSSSRDYSGYSRNQFDDPYGHNHHMNTRSQITSNRMMSTMNNYKLRDDIEVTLVHRGIANDEVVKMLIASGSLNLCYLNTLDVDMACATISSAVNAQGSVGPNGTSTGTHAEPLVPTAMSVCVYDTKLNPKQVTISAMSSFARVVSQIRECLGQDSASDTTSASLYWQSSKQSDAEVATMNSQGQSTIVTEWFMEISRTSLSDSEDHYVKSLCDLHTGDTVWLKSTGDNIGLPQKILMLASNFRHNKSMVRKVDRLQSMYQGWRSVRGDGNCYYRAIIFSLLEQIITGGDRCKFELLAAKFRDVTLPELDIGDGHSKWTDREFLMSREQLNDILLQAASGARWLTVMELETEMVDIATGLDLALVMTCRSLVARYLLDKADQEVNGLSLRDAILPSYEVRDMHDYVTKYVMSIAVDAEGPFVDFGILLRALNCWGLTVFFDRRSQIDMNVHENSYDDTDTLLGTVHLLLRPGHYDVLYPLNRDNYDGSPFVRACDARQILMDTEKDQEPESVVSASVIGAFNKSDNFAGSSSCGAGFVEQEQEDGEEDLDEGSWEVSEQFALFMRTSRVIVASLWPALQLSHGILIHDRAKSVLRPSLNQAMFYAYKNIYCTKTDSINDFLVNVKNVYSIDPMRAVDLTLVSRGRENTFIAELLNRPQCSSEVSYKDTTSQQHSLDNSSDGDWLFVDINKVVTLWLNISKVPCAERTIHNERILITVDLEEFRSVQDFTARMCTMLSVSCENFAIKRNDMSDLSFLAQLENNQELLMVDRRVINVQCPKIGLKAIHLTEQDDIFTCKKKIRTAFHIAAEYLELYFMNMDEEIVIETTDVLKMVPPKGCVVVRFCETSATGSSPSGSSSSSSSVGCKTKCKRLVKVEGCKHIVCEDCLNSHLESVAVDIAPLGLQYEESESPRQKIRVKSIFEQPKLALTEGAFVPVMRDVTCPVGNCMQHLSESTLGSLSRFVEDYQTTCDAVEDHYQKLRTYRKCCLSELICGADLEPRHKMFSLGCDHHFHSECLAAHVKNEVENETRSGCPQRLVCVECVKTANTCWCSNCSAGQGGAATSHFITEQEVKGLYERNALSISELNKWENYQLQLALSSDTGYFTCRCNTVYYVEAGNETITCPACNFKTCLACKKQAHPTLSCAQAAEREKFEASQAIGEGAGILMQNCPGCNQPWGVPIECLHATCEPGCGMVFCYCCLAPRTPTTSHNNSYHRPTCDFYSICCVKECTGNGQLATCVMDTYQPGPCKACQEANTVNDCTHSSWRPCFDCRQGNPGKAKLPQPCTHWCLQCVTLGQLCSPPGNPGNKYRVVTHNAVQEEAKMQDAIKMKV